MLPHFPKLMPSDSIDEAHESLPWTAARVRAYAQHQRAPAKLAFIGGRNRSLTLSKNSLGMMTATTHTL